MCVCVCVCLFVCTYICSITMAFRLHYFHDKKSRFLQRSVYHTFGYNNLNRLFWCYYLLFMEHIICVFCTSQYLLLSGRAYF